MNRGRIIIFIVFLVLLATLVWMIFGGRQSSWRVTYRASDKGPYGTFLFRNLLEASTDSGKFSELNTYLDKSLPVNDPWDAEGDEPASDNYFFTGRHLYLTPAETAQLIDFVWEGNIAFIFTEDLPLGLLENIQTGYDTISGETIVPVLPWIQHTTMLDTAKLIIRHPYLEVRRDFIFNNGYGPATGFWNYFIERPVEDANEMKTLRLGELDKYGPDILAIQHGYGLFIFHLNPITHTNYFLREPGGKAYTEALLAHAGSGKSYWDEFSHVPKPISQQYNGNGSAVQDGPLYFLLRNEALRWALFSLLGGVLLFLFFRGKRQQRVIPVIPPHENTSLEFVKTIADLYFQQNRPLNLALLKRKHFLFFVRNRYNVSLQQEESELARDIARRSGTPEESMLRILELGRIASAVSEASEELLKEYHSLLEEFYKTCK